MAKKKKTKKITHVLHEDCKACMRERNLSEPIIRDMLEAKKATLINFNYSLQALLEMNKVVHEGFLKICNKEDEKGFKAVDSYFEDIRKMIQFVMMIKGE